MAIPMTITTSAEERVDRLRVLLADDYRPILDFVRHLLERKFDIVGSVEDGESLVDAAKRLQPDIIVLDIAMPLPHRTRGGRRDFEARQPTQAHLPNATRRARRGRESTLGRRFGLRPQVGVGNRLGKGDRDCDRRSGLRFTGYQR